MRRRAFVAEARFFDFRVWCSCEGFDIGEGELGLAILFESFVVEVSDKRGSVMLFDDIDNNGRELVIFSEFDAFGYMAFYDEGAHGGVAFDMRVDAFGLVFDEVFGFDEFTDVVEKGCDVTK